MNKEEIKGHKWLAWAREIYSITQSGLTYCKSEFDLNRYRRLQEIAAEMLASQSELSEEAVLRSFSMQAGYITPKVSVRGAVIRDGKILLVRERVDGRWSMPGGWADLGAIPSEMVAREVREESGFEVHVEKLIAVYDANRIQPMEFYHAYKLIFLCALMGGQAANSFETSDVDFFDPGDLPPLSEFRTNRAMILEALEHAADKNRPAYFE